jgi:trimeric autotransporter adhesin
MTLSSRSSALVSPRVLLGVGLVALTSLFGGIGCGSYSLTSLYVEPASNLTCLYPGSTAQYHAYGVYTEGGHSSKIEDITSQVAWAVTISDLGNINTSGLATAANDGYVGLTSITATTQGEFGNLTADSTLQVSTSCSTPSSALKPFSLSMVPAVSQTFTAAGQTARFLAVATYNHGQDGQTTTDISRQATWQSSNLKVATVDATGLITAVGPGDATISVSSRAANGTLVTATQSVHFESPGQDQ